MIFKNDLSKQKKEERKLILSRLPFYVAGILIADMIFYAASARQMLLVPTIIFHVFIFANLIVMSYFLVRQSRKYYATYELEITDDFIEARNTGFSRRIQVSDIRSIVRVSNDVIVITDKNRNKIGVSSKLENHEQAEAALSKIMEIKKSTFSKVYNWFILLAALLYAASLALRNFTMFLIFCPLFAISIIISMIQFIMNKYMKLPIKIIMTVFYLYIVFMLSNGFLTVLKACL